MAENAGNEVMEQTGANGADIPLERSLPLAVIEKIKALKNLQLAELQLEKDFFKEVHELESKYIEKYLPLREQRKEIVTGEYEPTAKDCEWSYDDFTEESLLMDIQEKLKITDDRNDLSPDSRSAFNVGIPYFWLTVLKSVPEIADMIQIYDEPILSHLVDIKVKLSSNPMAFTLEFHFSPNKYFTNKILTKYYELKCEPDDEEPLTFEGPEIIKSEGCAIDWKLGQNITVRTIKKKQKHKTKETAVRIVTKTVQNDSFFNFFSPPEAKDDPETDDELDALLTADYEIGHVIRERLVPKAVLYYTGDAISDDEYEEEAEEEEDEGDEEEDEVDDEEDEDTDDNNDETDEEKNAAVEGKQKKKHTKGGSAVLKEPLECQHQ